MEGPGSLHSGVVIATRTWWPVKTGEQERDHPMGRGGLEQLPSTLGGPVDQFAPGLLSVPPGPAGRNAELTSAPTHHRQTPITTPASLWHDQQDFTKTFPELSV